MIFHCEIVSITSAITGMMSLRFAKCYLFFSKWAIRFTTIRILMMWRAARVMFRFIDVFHFLDHLVFFTLWNTIHDEYLNIIIHAPIFLFLHFFFFLSLFECVWMCVFCFLFNRIKIAFMYIQFQLMNSEICTR